MRPLDSSLRHVTAALLLVVAVVHALLVPEHLEEAPYAGVLFLLLTIACVALAGLLLLRDTRGAWAATGLVCLLALAAYVVSRTVGLPQLDDDIGNWGELLSVPALVAEVLALAVSSYVLHHSEPTTSRNQS